MSVDEFRLRELRNPEVLGQKEFHNTIWRYEVTNSKLYVGNLSYSATDQELFELFSHYGEVRSARVIGRRGFGFVEMGNYEEALKALKALNGKEFLGRTLRIEEARESR